MYSLDTREHLDKIFSKLAKRDNKQFEILQKTIKDVLEKPHQAKPLRAPMQNKRRVHVGKSFVLVFSIDEINQTVVLEEYDHHDVIYK